MPSDSVKHSGSLVDVHINKKHLLAPLILIKTAPLYLCIKYSNKTLVDLLCSRTKGQSMQKKLLSSYIRFPPAL